MIKTTVTFQQLETIFNKMNKDKSTLFVLSMLYGLMLITFIVALLCSKY